MAIICRKHQFNWQLLIWLVFIVPPVYLQLYNNQTACTTDTLNAKTVFEFWHDNTAGCEIDATNLYLIHKKLTLNIDKLKSDNINYLIGNHVTSTLMETLFNQLIATVSTKILNSKPELEKVINQLYVNEKDKMLVLKIWQKVLDECSLFMRVEDILQQLLLLTNGDLKLNLLEYFLEKYEVQYKTNTRFLPLITFGVTNVLRQRQLSRAPIGDPSIGRLLSKLPEQLLTIYQSWNYNISLLNLHYQEFIFPERNDDPTTSKRYLVSFIPGKNTFKVKGKFKLQFNPKGLLTFGAPYGSTYGYVNAEQGSAFICLDCAIEAAQWWQILWPNSDQLYFLLQNSVTQELLCSTNIKFTENLILTATSATEGHMTDPLCHWRVEKRHK